MKADGIELDPTKVKAISNFPAPTNLTELRSFMGLVNQMSGHSKEVSEATLPLQPLMKKKRILFNGWRNIKKLWIKSENY